MRINIPKTSLYILGVAIVFCVGVEIAHRSGLIRKIAIWNLPEEQIYPTWIQTQNEAGLLFNEGKYHEAEVKHRAVLRLLEERYGTEHHEVITAINVVAIACLFQGKLSEAEALFLRSLEHSRKLFGEDDDRLHISADGLFQIYYERSEYGKAEYYAKLNLQIDERSIGVSDDRLVESLEDLRSVYIKQGVNDKAFQLYERILEIKQKDSEQGRP